MGSVNATTAAMPHAHAATAGATTTGAHAAHVEPKAPRSGDPRFVDGSTGEFGQSKTIKQQDGPAYGGEPVKKNQNGDDKKQNNYGVTDANFTRTWGVIADPDSGQPMSYAQTMQAYNAAGAIESLYPEVYAKLVANQDAGRGTVLGGALKIFGITKSDGANGASLAGIDDATQGQIQGAQLGNLGSLKATVLDTQDFKGREWNRAHHPGSSWTAMKPLVEQQGLDWADAALMTGDSMISWSGRVLGSNNQDGNKTGFADDELAGLKYMALMEQTSGKNIIESVLGGHAATHLPDDKLTNPKINKFIGLPEGYRPTTPEDMKMVAGRIRQWVLQPSVQVDQGEFEKFVKAGNKTPLGQQLNGSGLLAQVQFEPKEQNNGGGGGGGNNDAAETAATVPTGLGQGQLTAADTTAVGGGDIAPINLPGSPTIDTRPTLANLGQGGPFPVIDPATNKLNKRLQDQLMTAYVEMLYKLNDSPFLDDREERDAFVEGAKKGVQFLKDATAVDPKLVTALKAEAAAAMKDGKLSPEEREALSEKLGEAGLEDLAAAVKDGKVTDKELAAFDEKLDGAVSAKLEKDLTKALEDGKLSPEERKAIEGRLGKESLDALEAGIKDGTVTKEELEAITKGVETDDKAAKDPKAKDAKDPKAGAEDAASGAEKVSGEKNGDTPEGATDAKTGATKVKADTKDAKDPKAGDTKPATDVKPAADAKPATDAKPASDAQPATSGGESADKPAELPVAA
ncbi:MAG: hypothetical protein JWM86_2789 [Thermoleophilia bacterium]|nr:hypothetical protein [Thermoleophilia bacterium]